MFTWSCAHADEIHTCVCTPALLVLLQDVEAGDVKLIGVEAGGEGMSGLNSATLTMGTPGVLHGTRTYLLQDDDGQVTTIHSLAIALIRLKQD